MRISFPLFVVVIFFLGVGAVHARPSDAWFLTAQEFKNLTRAEQKQYLKKVKQALGNLPEISRTFAADPPPTKSEKGRTPARAAPTGNFVTVRQLEMIVNQAESWRGPIPTLVLEYNEKDQWPKFKEGHKNGLWWLITARASLAKLPKDHPGRPALEKRIKSLETYYQDHRVIFNSTFNRDGSMDSGYEALRKVQSGKADLTTPGLLPDKALVNFQDKQPLQIAAPPPGKTTSVPESGEITPADTSDPHNLSERIPSLQGYRCMYAGFVIRQDPCRGPQQLPADVFLSGLDHSLFTCEGEKILCNPLLFGMKTSCSLKANVKDAEALKCLSSASPICVKRDKFATRNCGTESSQDSNLEAAAALIRLNPTAWNNYLTSFYELCDDHMIVMNDFAQIRDGEPRDIPEATLKDIEQTCNNAKKKLKKITDAYRTIDGKRPGKSTAPPAEAPAETDDGQK